MVKLLVSRSPLVAIGSIPAYPLEADFVGGLSIPLDAGIPLSSHPSHGRGFGPATPVTCRGSSKKAALGGLCAALKRVWDQKYRYLLEQGGEGIPMQSCTGHPSLFSSRT